MPSLVAIDIVVEEIKYFSLSRYLEITRDQRTMGSNGWEQLLVSHQPSKFGDHSFFGIRDIMFLVIENFTCLLSSNIISK